uniref:BRCT domain-containing protein n=1 Tax=Steinernema glaseri TaxID=37863 RepID=A0A1I8ADI6_9BILA
MDPSSCAYPLARHFQLSISLHKNYSPSTSSPESTPEDHLVEASRLVIKTTALAIYGGEIVLRPLVQFFCEMGGAVREVVEWRADVHFMSAQEESEKDKVNPTNFWAPLETTTNPSYAHFPCNFCWSTPFGVATWVSRSPKCNGPASPWIRRLPDRGGIPAWGRNPEEHEEPPFAVDLIQKRPSRPSDDESVARVDIAFGARLVHVTASALIMQSWEMSRVGFAANVRWNKYFLLCVDVCIVFNNPKLRTMIRRRGWVDSKRLNVTMRSVNM